MPLVFNPKIPDGYRLSIPKPKVEDYKSIRAKEIREIIQTHYPDLYEYHVLLLAHLYNECPVMSEDCAYKPGSARNDWGWGIGMAQWNINWRDRDWMESNGYSYNRNAEYVRKMREHYYRDHPEMKEWRHQVHRYLGDIKFALEQNGTIDQAILSWNRNAGMPYVYRVKCWAGHNYRSYCEVPGKVPDLLS